MAGFQTFDLANVLQAAEAIKAQRRQPAEDALRNRVLTAQAAQAEQSTMLQKQQADAQMDETKAHRAYNASVAVLASANPQAAAESLTPDFVKEFDATHGAGSWKNLTPEQAVQAAKAIQDHALTIIGPQVEVEWKDTGGQLVAYDKKTAQPISGAAPIAKTATPDATLSAQTSLRGQDITARGQDIGARTAAAGQALTARGQDIGAQTAAAGQAVTARGQDLTANTARQNTAATNPNSPQNIDKTWGTYQQAKAGLLRGLSASETGPIAGRIPAVTAAQQTAEGGVSAMAPVLKQLFRTAGEGTFTDRDQALLLEMVPTRKDHPETRQNKIENIDNIIRAKLGKPVPEARKNLAGKSYLKIGGQWFEDDGT